MINSEEDKCNNSQSLQISIPLIKVENQVNIKPNPTFTINLDNRRDSDQELANILANVIFQDSGRAKNQSTIKEESMSTIMRESEKVVEDTKDIYVPSSPINMNTLVKKSTFLDNILKFNKRQTVKVPDKKLLNFQLNREENVDTLRFAESPIGSKRDLTKENKETGFSKFREAFQTPTSKSQKKKGNDSSEIDGEYFQKLLKCSGMV